MNSFPSSNSKYIFNNIKPDTIRNNIMKQLGGTESKYQHGSVVRLYLRDFMQYSAVEMKPGPSLNVIIGPNGAGKSSVVNGLALALGMSF